MVRVEMERSGGKATVRLCFAEIRKLDLNWNPLEPLDGRNTIVGKTGEPLSERKSAASARLPKASSMRPAQIAIT